MTVRDKILAALPALERMKIVGADGRLAAAAGSPLLAAVKELGLKV
jgi:hypothetical protein